MDEVDERLKDEVDAMDLVDKEKGEMLRLYFEEVGAGRPVVFLHGWAMSGRAWYFQRDLKDAGRLIFVDQRGHGSSAPGTGYTVQDYAEDLVALFRELDLKDAVLVGWSMGVQVALQAYAELAPRLAALVLVGGTPRFTSCEGYPHGQAPQDVKGMGLRVRRDFQKTMGDFFRGMFAEGEMDKEQYQRIVHQIVMAGRSPAPDAVLQSLQILATVDQRSLLPAIEVPVLLVHGELDATVPAGASRYMAQQIARVRLEIMDGCGHAPFMTRPELFNGVVREFLAELD